MGQSALSDILKEQFTTEAVNQSSFYLHYSSSEVATHQMEWLLHQNTSYGLDVDNTCYLQDHMQGWVLQCLYANTRRIQENTRKALMRRGIRNDCKKTVTKVHH